MPTRKALVITNITIDEIWRFDEVWLKQSCEIISNGRKTGALLMSERGRQSEVLSAHHAAALKPAKSIADGGDVLIFHVIALMLFWFKIIVHYFCVISTLTDLFVVCALSQSKTLHLIWVEDTHCKSSEVCYHEAILNGVKYGSPLVDCKLEDARDTKSCATTA